MKQFRKRTSKGTVRAIAMILTFALVATSLAFTPNIASAKKAKVSRVKMFSKTLVLAPGKSMKLKPDVKVSPNKKANKKVTYQSSDSKIVSVSKAGVIKAKGKKGKKAKITIASKLNKKKKVTVTVKIGTRVKSIKIKSGGKIVKTLNLKAKGDGKELKIAYTPKKATYRTVSWKSSKSSVASVNAYGIVVPRKKGKATITATTKDGSNKKAKCTVNVAAEAADTSTPAPTRKPFNYKRTPVENFESYAVGKTWPITVGESFVGKKTATATVVKDPTNPNNKVLKIAYDGDTQAYDVAPYFTVDLAKVAGIDPSLTKLEDFVAIGFKTKLESNAADCRYKTIKCYFAEAGSINPKYYFATNDDKPDEWHKYKNEESMAEGEDKDYTDSDTGKTDNQKNFPMYFDGYPADPKKVSPGFVEAQNDSKIPFVERVLNFKTARMKNPSGDKKSLLGNTKFDMMLGTTYEGNFKARDMYLTLYIDDIQLLSNATSVGLTGINLTSSTGSMLCVGLSGKIRTTFVPANTTEKSLTWSSLNEDIATVNDEGLVTGLKTGKATIKATSKIKPNISKTIEIEVYEPEWATEKQELLPLATIIPSDSANTKLKSDASAEFVAEGLKLNYASENQSVVIDLGKEVDFTPYKSLEIVGQTPGSVAIELYNSSLDKTKDNWWDKAQGAEYPFFNGSCETRLEDGAYNEESLPSTQEEARYSLKTLANSEKRDGDFTKIRYIVLKSNNGAIHPSGFDKGTYLINRITLSTKEEVKSYLPIDLTETNESILTKTLRTSAQFGVGENGSPFASFVANSSSSGMAFYIDAVKDLAKVDERNSAVDLSEYRYVKVSVEAPNNKLILVGLEDGQAWPTSGFIALTNGNLWQEAGGVDNRTIYFSLKTLSKDFTKMDVLGIRSTVDGASVKVNSMELVKGEPLIPDDKKDSTYILTK